MRNIIVRCPQDQVEHLLNDKLAPNEGSASWSVGNLPKHVESDEEECLCVYFQAGDKVIGVASRVEINREQRCFAWDRENAFVFAKPQDVGEQGVLRGWRYFDDYSLLLTLEYCGFLIHLTKRCEESWIFQIFDGDLEREDDYCFLSLPWVVKVAKSTINLNTSTCEGCGTACWMEVHDYRCCECKEGLELEEFLEGGR